MYFLAINKARPDADPKAIVEVVPAHKEWVKQGIDAGKIVQAGKWGDAGGVVVVKAAGIEEGQVLLEGDPLHRSGLFTLEVHGFHPDVESPSYA